MNAVLLTIQTPERSIDLSVPAHMTVADLLTLIAPVECGPEHRDGWTLMDGDGETLDPTRTLDELGVLDGSRLALTPAGTFRSHSPGVRAPRTMVAPADRSNRVIPDRTSPVDRIRITLSALLGRHRPRGSAGPIDRARRAWEWTDHRRRLEWLLTRPRIHRSVVIGVVGHRSDELAESLADELAATRIERIVLVDGGFSASVSRRLRESGPGLETLESGLRRKDVTSIERDLLFGRTARGTLTVPTDPTTPQPDYPTLRRLLDSLRSHAGLVVADCGPVEHASAGLIEHCDQLVASSTGTVLPTSGQSFLAIWGDAEAPADHDMFAIHRVSDDPVSVLELAVVIASGWAEIDAATPVPLGM